MGRTARLGAKGSFSIILLDTNIEKFNISNTDIIKNQANIYDFIHQKRNEYFNKK